MSSLKLLQPSTPWLSQLCQWWDTSSCLLCKSGGGRVSWLDTSTIGTGQKLMEWLSPSEAAGLLLGREAGRHRWAVRPGETTRPSTCQHGTGKGSCWRPISMSLSTTRSGREHENKTYIMYYIYHIYIYVHIIYNSGPVWVVPGQWRPVCAPRLSWPAVPGTEAASRYPC